MGPRAILSRKSHCGERSSGRISRRYRALTIFGYESLRRHREYQVMQSETDLLAQWTGEELFAAGRASPEERALHRRRGEFFLDLLRALRSQAGRGCSQELKGESEISRLLSIAFASEPKPRKRRR